MDDFIDAAPSAICASIAIFFTLFWWFDTGGFSGRQILVRQYLLHLGIPGTALVAAKSDQMARNRGAIPVYTVRLRPADPSSSAMVPYYLTGKGYALLNEGQRVRTHYLPGRPDDLALDDDLGYTTPVSLFGVVTAFVGTFLLLLCAVLVWPRRRFRSRD